MKKNAKCGSYCFPNYLHSEGKEKKVRLGLCLKATAIMKLENEVSVCKHWSSTETWKILLIRNEELKIRGRTDMIQSQELLARFLIKVETLHFQQQSKYNFGVNVQIIRMSILADSFSISLKTKEPSIIFFPSNFDLSFKERRERLVYMTYLIINEIF